MSDRPAVAGEDITIGEVWRRMLAIESEMHHGFDSMRIQINELKVVTIERYVADQATNSLRFANNEKRIDAIEEKNRWMFRTTVAAVMGALLSMLLTIALARGGW